MNQNQTYRYLHLKSCYVYVDNSIPYYLVKKMEISFIDKISAKNSFTHFLQKRDRQITTEMVLFIRNKKISKNERQRNGYL